MSYNYYDRYRAIEQLLEDDAELKHLKQRLQQAEEKLRVMMPSLTGEQKEILTEYLGVCGEIDQRIVEIVSFFEG